MHPAFEVYSSYLRTVMGVTSLSLRTGREEEWLRVWLKEIAFRAEEERWREWAREKLVLRADDRR